MLVINYGSETIAEILLPATGALLVAFYLGYKEVWIKRPEPFRKWFYIVNLEYSKGHIIPFQNAVGERPSAAQTQDLWLRYLSRWRTNFSTHRNPGLSLEPKFNSSDRIFYEFFECFVLTDLSERFGLGWNIDESHLSSLPFGRSGGVSSGVPSQFYDRVQLRELLKAGSNRFVDSLPKGEGLQLAVPRGTKVTVLQSSYGLDLRFSNPRFEGSISIEMSQSVLATGMRDDFYRAFYEKIHRKFGKFNPDKSFADLEERVFTMNFGFTQNAFRRFSDQAQFDATFIPNISSYFFEGLSWESVGPKIEAAI